MFIPDLPPTNNLTQSIIIEQKQVQQENNMILNETQVRQKLADLPEWITSGQYLSKTYQFRDFIQAIKFVNRLVEPSEALGHHPDINISYNKVTIHLTTHDAGGITQKDFDLAKEIVKIANSF